MGCVKNLIMVSAALILVLHCYWEIGYTLIYFQINKKKLQVENKGVKYKPLTWLLDLHCILLGQ